jgi:hypothetical protein
MEKGGGLDIKLWDIVKYWTRNRYNSKLTLLVLFIGLKIEIKTIHAFTIMECPR